MALREPKTNGKTLLPEVEDTTTAILQGETPSIPAGIAEAFEGANAIGEGYEPGQEQDAETVATIFRRVALEQDMNRVKVGAALMNVFNYAVQVQAGRNDWNHDDFRAFIVAHSAIDQIGKAHIAKTKEGQNETHLRAVEAAITEQQITPRRPQGTPLMPEHRYPERGQ